MDLPALGLSATFAAAKLGLALWFGQLALSVLDRRREMLAWQLVLAAATVVISWWAVRTSGAPAWWAPAWVTSSLLAAAAFVDCVRRWLSAPTAAQRAELVFGATAPARKAPRKQTSSVVHGSQRIHDFIAVIGVGLTALASAAAVLRQLPPESLIRAAAVAELIVGAGLLGTALAASCELTMGATGRALLGLNWRGLGRWAIVGLLVQLAISGVVIGFRRDGATPAESLTPIFFAVGMVIVGYIVWAIPRQMLSLAARGQMEGQASLAVAGWLAVICLAVACALPPAWPWNQLRPTSNITRNV